MPGAHAVERPRTVGVLVDWLESEYQSAVVGGVIGAAREHGVNVVSFVGGVLGLPSRHGRQRNAVYDLAASDGIDGLVVMAGTLGNHGGLAELAAYLDRYRPIPMVSIAATMPGTTGILIDGEHALRDGIRHLVEHHQYRRIAFLGGPANNLEAQARLRTYGEMLATYSLRPPESFVAVGDFQYESGVEAIRVLVDERAVEFDAIVVANDQMSLGVVDALRARGKRVPRDVAIIGFDDIPEARYSAPPLTTIRQPLGAQGRLSVEVLLRHWRGEPVDDVLTLPTELVLRQSCGCHSDVRRANATSHLPPPLTRPGTSPGVEETCAIVGHGSSRACATRWKGCWQASRATGARRSWTRSSPSCRANPPVASPTRSTGCWSARWRQAVPAMPGSRPCLPSGASSFPVWPATR